MKVHHIGYLVDSIESAVCEFEKLGFTPIGEVTDDLSRDAWIQFLENSVQRIELIAPCSDKSPVYGLRKKYRNSPYHICYSTTSAGKDKITLDAAQVKILIERRHNEHIIHIGCYRLLTYIRVRVSADKYAFSRQCFDDLRISAVHSADMHEVADYDKQGVNQK